MKIGLEPERVRMFYMSSAQAAQFAEAAKEMTEQIAAIGPNPLRTRISVEEQNGTDEQTSE